MYRMKRRYAESEISETENDNEPIEPGCENSNHQTDNNFLQDMAVAGPFCDMKDKYKSGDYVLVKLQAGH
ncbi:hypothetical protein HW555_008122 [Spodoptera exigua]|uniref:Uncharacterized protein n=1 Tax=Spodoptera exigua TaxID=7107 RepID=A0A835GD00_SPOEX|nr:hypothetical protein HW555_008122 [Spodoptera exigua]